jgi:DNA-binding NtrC family response regulator
MSGISISTFPDSVLVVDDEPIVMQVLMKVLPAHGLKAASAKTAEDALVRLEKDAFGCVLTDKNLPGMNGLDLIRQTRKLQPHCACIIMTAYASTESAVEALRLGATDYLEKPFQDIDLVGEKVRLATQHHRDAFERNRLLRKLREFQAELDSKEKENSQQRTEIQMFNEILEARVKQATKDLQWKLDEYEQRLTPKASVRDAEIIGVEMALMMIEDLTARPGEKYAAVRGDLQRIVRQLQSQLQLLRDKKGQAA